MKKVISIMICILIVIQLGIGILSESNREIEKLSGLEDKYCKSFSMPDNENINNPEKVYEILKKTADRNNANTFRSLLKDGEDGGYEVVKFIYLSGESHYFNYFKITGKTFKTINGKMEDSEDFISSRDTENENQIGKISTHMHNLDITLRTLNQQMNYFKTSGLYYVEFLDENKKEKFIQELKQSLENEFSIELENQDFEAGKNKLDLPYTDSGFYVIMEMVSVFLIILCCMYYYFRENKQIAVHNLFGITEKRTTFLLQKGFYGVCLIGMVSGIAVLLIYSRDPLYVWSVIWRTIVLLAVLFGLLYIIGIFFQHIVDIHDALTGKSSTNHILCFNYLVKAVCIIIVLYIGGNIYAEYKEYNTVKQSYKSWENAKDYGVFYPYYIGYDLTEQEQCSTEKTISEDLYSGLNAKEAIYINSRNFEQEYLDLNGEPMPWESVTVNPNYLIQFPVLDENGKEITISEKETDWILIVPEKYKEQEEEIVEIFSEDRKDCYETSEDVYGEEISAVVKNQNVKIIWMKDNQKIFSFNSNVYPENNNMIEEPVIQVMTTNNSCTIDRYCVQGNGTTDPLKLKISGDSKKTYESLKDLLSSQQLDDNLKHIVSCNEEAAQKLNTIYANIRLSAMLLAVLIFVWLLNSFQSTVILFDKNKKDFVIKRISGWNWQSIYGKYLWREFAVLLFITAGIVVANPIKGANMYCYFGIDALIVLIEVAVFQFCIRYSEKNKVVEALKGE
ncbi:MAG: DUF1430 domain-containing protein [Lachnospiraceae bacterium]|nr:DUF1430 domain-containing protein [Lachnospiraceae bacterium]